MEVTERIVVAEVTVPHGRMCPTVDLHDVATMWRDAGYTITRYDNPHHTDVDRMVTTWVATRSTDNGVT